MRASATVTLAIMVLGTAGIGYAVTTHPAVRLTYNPSPSAPHGFYTLAPVAPKFGTGRRTSRPRPPQRGQLILAWPPVAAARLADHRNYVPLGVPLLKSVSAAFRDRVCRFGPAVTINGRLAAIALSEDRAGLALPAWHGCHRLGEEELFLLGATAASFDSRYFGPVSRAAVIGHARPLWTW